MFSGMTHKRLPFEQHSIILCLTIIHSLLLLMGHFVVGEMFSADKVNQLHGKKKKRLGNSDRCPQFTEVGGGGHAVTVKRLPASASHGSFPSLYICFA